MAIHLKPGSPPDELEPTCYPDLPPELLKLCDQASGLEPTDPSQKDFFPEWEIIEAYTQLDPAEFAVLIADFCIIYPELAINPRFVGTGT